MIPTANKLINAIASTNTSDRYALFLGAGCSVSSGIRPAGSLVQEWRARKFMLEEDFESSGLHTRDDYFLLAWFCSVQGPHLGKKSAQELEGEDYRCLTIYHGDSDISLTQEILDALGESSFVDTRQKGWSSTWEYKEDSNPPIARRIGGNCFGIDEARHFCARFHSWLDEQPWYKSPSEYSILFESLYPLPSQRQAYIEKEVENARPYWGYLYLANMMSRGYFNVCFTTNFDDLLNDAFSAFVADKKPAVCSHDAMVSQMRLTSKRPKIIKLHGDFLYDSIKNTQKEVLSLDKNMEAKLSQFAKELGLIVVGYGGNDASVMGVLENLLKCEDNFQHGIHWCMLKNAPRSQRLVDLLQYDRVLLYEIQSFDSLLADFYEAFQMPEPTFSTNPILLLGHEIDRCSSVVFSQDPHPLIDRHIRELERNVDGLLSQREKPLPNKTNSADAKSRAAD